MKSVTLLCFCILVSLTPMRAADETDTAPLNVEEKLRLIDQKIQLQQYEQVSTELAAMELKLALLEDERELPKDAREKEIERISHRSHVLMRWKDQLREQLKHREAESVAAKIAAKKAPTPSTPR